MRNWPNQPDAKAKPNERRLELEGIALPVPRPARKGELTMSEYDRPLTPEQIATTKDENIEFSEIPELDETFWRQAEIIEPDLTQQITLRVKRSVLAYFRAPGKGYQTRINRVLESYVRAQRGSR